MELKDVIDLIQTVGFPIVCCVVLFRQNEKYQKSISELTQAVNKMSNLLNLIKNNLKGGDVK